MKLALMLKRGAFG